MKPLYNKALLLVFILSVICLPIYAQISLGGQNNTQPDFSGPQIYEIGGITVTGDENLQKDLIILVSGLSVGDKIAIPGDEISDAINKLWKQNIFDDVSIHMSGKQGNIVFLEIRLSELPKLSKFAFKGVKKSKQDNLRDEINLSRGKIVTENLKVNTKNRIKRYYIEKGYLNAEIDITEEPDTTRNNEVILTIHVDKGKRIKINKINFEGNEAISDRKLRRAMEETKQKNFFRLFKSSKFQKQLYKDDKDLILELYREKGYRDAAIAKDSIYRHDANSINIDMTIEEGKKYYFRNIDWLGNTVYDADTLRKVLGIEKGDVYDATVLDMKLFGSPNGRDVSALYLDNGYLFFDLVPIEVLVKNDSIDLELRIREGKQATISKVTISGNVRTNDYVIMREIRTKPGELFRRSDIQRTFRELSQLGFFDPQQIGVNPVPNPQTGTVDIEYTVIEQSTSQIQLQGGWGGGRVVGTFALSFNNFSTKNIFKKGAWAPLPSGDGQSLTLSAQSNGSTFQAYRASFTEPWLGGKKPTSLTVSLYHNIQTNGRKDANKQELKVTGVGIGIGKRLKWPDDYFTLYQGIDYQYYSLNNFQTSFFKFDSGNSNNISYRMVLGRNSTDQPIYPRTGSSFNLSLKLTPPYSLFKEDDFYKLSPEEIASGELTDSEIEAKETSRKFKFIEYHKWKFTGTNYTELAKDFVLKTHAEMGFLGSYNSSIGLAPFERFYVGGDGLQNFVLDGRETIGLRGYPNDALSSDNGGALYNKFTLEFRYLISPNPQATIYGLVFAEGGNAWDSFEEYKPFQLKRSVGTGIRIFMPFLGMLGVDFGYGYDNIPGSPVRSGWQTHFIIGQQL